MATSLVGLIFFARRTNDASVMLPLSQPLVPIALPVPKPSGLIPIRLKRLQWVDLSRCSEVVRGWKVHIAGANADQPTSTISGHLRILH
jgi:hypothetical protein